VGIYRFVDELYNNVVNSSLNNDRLNILKNLYKLNFIINVLRLIIYTS
jgi:hypothetical protein